MPQVVIDGVEYVAGGSAPRIGIGVKTRNRNKIVTNTLEQIRKHTPGATVVVVDDASDKPVEGADYRFEKNAGIARASNKCLELLYNAGAEHIFLFDDDTYPLVDDWYAPYIESPEPHLMWIFDKPKGVQKRQVEVLYEGEQFTAYHATRGCMIYVERRVLDRVGGMNPAFGQYGWEHVSWSDRIHSAGFTTARYMDAPNSGGLIHSMDQEGTITSTATEEAKRFSMGPGMELRMESRHSDAYVEFRDLEHVVLTCLLTSQNDPQRGKPMQASPAMLNGLQKSLKHDGRFVVFHDNLTGDMPGAELVKVVQRLNPYFERWVQYYQWLRDNPQVGFVWCVDGTDVTMTRDPFPEMEPGTLYMGTEGKTLRDPWMLSNHPDTDLQEFMKANPNLPILNMGVVGGDRETVMRFAHLIVKFYFDDVNAFIMGWEHGRVGIGDMGTGQYIAYTHFKDQISSGAHVTNIFKSKIGIDNAWWAHKPL